MARKYIDWDKKWRQHANFIMRYEDMIEHPQKIVDDLTQSMGVRGIDSLKICEKIDNMSYKSSTNRNQVYHSENLFHDGHITNGGHGAWTNSLSPGLIAEIEVEFADWLAENNYPV